MRWIAFSSAQTGHLEIYIQPFPGPGEPMRISTAGGDLPRWRRDGRELFYLTADGRVMAVPITASGSTIDAGTPTELFHARVPSQTLGPGRPYEPAPDGTQFVVAVMPDTRPSPINVILNWHPTNAPSTVGP
jgi:hypothetical protein